MQKAKLGFIGAGAFATGKLYPCIPASGLIDLVAVCDIDREKAEANARHFGARLPQSKLSQAAVRSTGNGYDRAV